MIWQLRRRWLEDAIVVCLSALATLHAEWRMISKPLTFQGDATIHEFWMRRFQDEDLFHDPLTEALLDTGYSPPGFRSLYWLASHLVDPVFFGELLPLVLQPFAVWAVFRIVRHHVSWWPAAWIGAALFLVPWDIHRFSGGHPRAFAQPIVLAVVLLLLRRHFLAAALVPPLGLLFYPPAGAVALLVVGLAALDRNVRHFVDWKRARWAGVSAVGAIVALILTRLTTASQDVITADEARRYPEFGPHGQMNFFADSVLDYLKENYSGFFLQDSGSLIAVSALLLLLLQPRNARLLRWEVWCMPIAALLLFGAAHALLFRLYLPHRYTYALLPFFCIAIAVSLRPTFETVAARFRWTIPLAPFLPLAAALLALVLFPFGPQISLSQFGAWLDDAVPYLVAGLAVGMVVAALAWLVPARRTGASDAFAGGVLAILIGAILVAELTFADGGRSPGAMACRDVRLYRELRDLPKDAIIAADPFQATCIPIAAERAVVISRKLYQPWAVEYFELIRDRMFSTVSAFYGGSQGQIADLRKRYGADYLAVRTGALDRSWPTTLEPFTSKVESLRARTDIRAPMKLPDRCLTWRAGGLRLYDLACAVGGEAP